MADNNLPSQIVSLAQQLIALPVNAQRQVLTLANNPDKFPEPAPAKGRTSWSMAEVFETDFPDQKWAVPGLIPVGLSFLAGRPKLGKSWLALQMACAVGSAGMVLGTRVERGRVLYLALEDSLRRLKERAIKQGIPPHAAIQFSTAWAPLANGGLEALRLELMAGQYSLCIIDTLSRALGRSDQMDLAEMTAILGELQAMAIGLDLAILAIDHHRKGSGSEASPVDDILGSTAKAAVADGALGLYREHGKRGATLKVTGREVEERDIALQWDALTGCWQTAAEPQEAKKDCLKGDIVRAIQDITRNGALATTKRIAEYLHRDETNVSHDLAHLVYAGQIQKGSKSGREQPYEIIN